MPSCRRCLALCVGLALLACGGDRSDEQIAADVEQQLSNSPVLGGTEIEVTTRGGVVTLAGVVSSDEQRARAESLAWGVDGVESVESRLEVAPGTPGGAPDVAAPPPAEPAEPSM